MPRLSLWRETHSNDYKFFDRRISEMFTVGGTGVFVHKYLGVTPQDGDGDATKPNYADLDPTHIQDLLFLENRDRKYDTSIYKLRGIYQVSDNDFDLTQFGLFLTTGTLFLTFHLNDMIEILGRKIMSGDVIELMHLKEYNALNDVPLALKRFFIVGDCSRASEGFSPTWWPHLWRCKISPLVDSQEYKDILNQVATGDSTLRDILSTYNKYNDINSAVIQQAEVEVPMSGYDTSGIYIQPVQEDLTGKLVPSSPDELTADNVNTAAVDASTGNVSGTTADQQLVTPDSKVKGYLTGDGLAPNGLPVSTGISFPGEPAVGDYCLRLDYLPNRLFRYDGKRWVKVEDAVRTNLTPGAVNNKTLKNSFINNSDTYVDNSGNVHSVRQNLSRVFKPKADN